MGHILIKDDVGEACGPRAIPFGGETARGRSTPVRSHDLETLSIARQEKNRAVSFLLREEQQGRAVRWPVKRGGTGAVGGSKQLKAIVIQGKKKKSQVDDPDAWKAARRQALDAIRDETKITSPRKGGLSIYGTNSLMNIASQLGALPTRNSQLTSFGERAESISGEYVTKNLLVGDPTCHA